MSSERLPGEAGRIQSVLQTELPAANIVAYYQDTEPMPTAETWSSTFERLRNKWTTVGAIALTGLLLAKAPTFQAPAFASNANQAVIGMPFEGKWAYVNKVNPPYTDINSSHPSVHSSYGFQGRLTYMPHQALTLRYMALAHKAL